MKITRNIFLGLFAASIVACSSAPEETVETTDAKEVVKQDKADAYSVENGDNTITWVGFKTFGSGRHNGTITITDGRLFVRGEALEGGKFSIDMNSIHNEDLPVEGDYNQEKLVGHLKSADFFDAANHPQAMFEITEVTAENNEEKGTSHKVSGNLTMRGITKNISFPATVEVTPEMVSFQAPEFSIDRKNWNVMFGSTGIEGIAKDNLIDDNILLTVNLTAARK